MKTFYIKKKNKKIKLTVIDLENSNLKRVTVSGPLGSLSTNFKGINLSENKLFIEQSNLNFFLKKIKKLIKSVSNGWFVELNLNGLGYKSFKLNDKIALDLGYSNLIVFKTKDDIKIKNFKNKIVLFGLDQEYLNNVCSNIQNYSKPDPYKGKGILYKNQIVKLKKKAKS